MPVNYESAHCYNCHKKTGHLTLVDRPWGQTEDLCPACCREARATDADVAVRNRAAAVQKAEAAWWKASRRRTKARQRSPY